MMVYERKEHSSIPAIPGGREGGREREMEGGREEGTEREEEERATHSLSYNFGTQ